MADATIGLEGRKTTFATLGSTLFVAGVALGGSAICAVVDAPPMRDLMMEWVLLSLAAVMIAGGGYVFIAAMSEHLWLPGMKRIRKTALDHAFARQALTRAVARGLDFTVTTNQPDRIEIRAWFAATLDFIESMWGETEMALVAGGAREIPLDGKNANDLLHPVLLRLETFLARCSDVPLRPSSEWSRLSDAQWKAMLGDAIQLIPTDGVW